MVGKKFHFSLLRNQALEQALAAQGKLKSIYLIRTYEELVDTLLVIVEEAEQVLVAAGSRSRDKRYLEAIETKLRENPRLVHYRVMFGSPHNQIFKEHLLKLLEFRDPMDREFGHQTLHIGLFTKVLIEAENNICANEKMALIVLPSTEGVGKYTTALVLQDAADVQAMIRFVRELYSASKPCEIAESIKRMQPMRSPFYSPGL